MNIEQRMQQLRDLAKQRAKSKAQKEYLEHFRKSQLAILKKEYAVVKDGAKFMYPSSASQDDQARADHRYLETLTGLKIATEEYEYMNWELKIAEMGAGLWQTKQANERAERKGYGA